MVELLSAMLLLALVQVDSGEKILVIPFFNTSETMMANAIANQLVARIYSFTWLWPKDVPTEKILNNPKYEIMRCKMQ